LRVLATHYDEIVVDRLYEDKCQLDASLGELVTLAEQALALTETQRKRTILRIDGGGSDDKNINALLARDYHTAHQNPQLAARRENGGVGLHVAR
jgi:hypothetical protein